MMYSEKLITFLGKVPGINHGLRWAARRYREGSVVRIRHGVAAGLLWKRHHRYVNGYWIGHYEPAIQQALRRELRPGDTFYDVGANAGFFALVGARCVGPTGKVVAFDPSPDNVESLQEQIALNGLAGLVTPVREAVGACCGRAAFAFAAPGAATGHLGEAQAEERTLDVQVTTLDEAADRFGLPHFIKLDVEGAEAQVLEGARHVLQTARPTWLLEIHGADPDRKVRGILCAHGYQLTPLVGGRLVEPPSFPHHVLARPA